MSIKKQVRLVSCKLTAMDDVANMSPCHYLVHKVRSVKAMHHGHTCKYYKLVLVAF